MEETRDFWNDENTNENASGNEKRNVPQVPAGTENREENYQSTRMYTSDPYRGVNGGNNYTGGDRATFNAGAFRTADQGGFGGYQNTAGNTGNTAGNTYNTTGNTYNTSGNAGANTGNAYNNNAGGFGNADQNVYDNSYRYDRKAEKKAEKEQRKRARAEAKARYKSSGKSSFAGTLGKCAAAALVFGLVGGSVFSGVVYFTGTPDRMSASLEGRGPERAEVAKELPDDKGAAPETVNVIDRTNLIQATTLPDVSELVAQTMPSVVSITTLSTVTQMSWFGQQITSEEEYAGSGIIVAEDGNYLYIATNDHVSSNANTMTVEFIDGESADAQLKGSYSSDDLSVLKVDLSDISDETRAAIKVAKINDSGDYVVGSSVIAIGNALGYGQTVTSGIISATNREMTFGGTTDGRTYTNTLIQTDAPINPGNSGGALINAAGEVIGMNEGGVSTSVAENMGFAIPMSTLKPLIDNIIQREDVPAGEECYIGIVGVDVDKEVASTYGMPTGVYIAKITKNSPADTSELMVGDILTAIDNNKIGSKKELDEILEFYAAGTDVTLTVYRANAGVYEEVKIPMTLALRSDFESTSRRG